MLVNMPFVVPSRFPQEARACQNGCPPSAELGAASGASTVVRALFPSSANLRRAARTLKSQRRRLLDSLEGAMRAVGPCDLGHAEKSAPRLVPVVLAVAGGRCMPGTTADARRSRSDRLALVYTAPPSHRRYITSIRQPATSRKYPQDALAPAHPATAASF